MEYIENFNINPMDMIIIPDLITESNFDVDSYLISEAEETKKKNIFQKLWGILKKLFRIIRQKASEISSAFMSIFRTKKVDDKTLDQIAEYVLGISDKEPGTKHLRFRYDNDKTIRINYLANTVKKLVKEPEIAGHAKDDRPEQNAIMLVFHLIKHPYKLDPIIEMLESIKQNNGEIKFDIKRMRNAINSVWAATAVGFSCNITMEEWTTLNNKIISLNKAMETIDDDTFNAITIHQEGETSVNKEWASLLNELVRVTSFLQKGINTVGDGMRQIYELDGKFHNKINVQNFQKKLPLFMKLCVESNIPSKYIYNAVHQICDISINSFAKDGSIKLDEPVRLKGNGRFVMFPSDVSLDGKIIKIAYNGLGSRGNRNEFEVWNRVKDIPEIADQLYHIYDIGDNDYYVILTDRAVPIDHYDQCEEWNKNMKQLCIDNNVGFIIRCNDGGFGKIGDKIVCIDYGNVHRI